MYVKHAQTWTSETREMSEWDQSHTRDRCITEGSEYSRPGPGCPAWTPLGDVDFNKITGLSLCSVDIVAASQMTSWTTRFVSSIWILNGDLASADLTDWIDRSSSIKMLLYSSYLSNKSSIRAYKQPIKPREDHFLCFIHVLHQPPVWPGLPPHTHTHTTLCKPPTGSFLYSVAHFHFPPTGESYSRRQVVFSSAASFGSEFRPFRQRCRPPVRTWSHSQNPTGLTPSSSSECEYFHSINNKTQQNIFELCLLRNITFHILLAHLWETVDSKSFSIQLDSCL